jgi:hypothetical protein
MMVTEPTCQREIMRFSRAVVLLSNNMLDVKSNVLRRRLWEPAILAYIAGPISNQFSKRLIH